MMQILLNNVTSLEKLLLTIIIIIKERKFGHFLKCAYCGLIDHFTAAEGNEARVDLVLMQSFRLYYVNRVVLMPANWYFLSIISIRKLERGLYQNKVNLSLTFTRRLGY